MIRPPRLHPDLASLVKGLTAKMRIYPEGTELYSMQSSPAEAFVILDGLVKLQRTDPSGTETLVGVRSGVWVLGLVEVMSSSPHLNSAITLSPVRGESLTRYQICEHMDNSRAVRDSLLTLLSLEAMDTLERLCQLAAFSSRQRLEYCLGELLLENRRRNRPNPNRLRLPMKEYEVASLLYMTPSHLCRLLNELEGTGRIKRDKGSLTLTTPMKFPSNILWEHSR